MKIRIIPLVIFICLTLVNRALSNNDYPLTRVGITGKMHLETGTSNSLVLRLCSNYDIDDDNPTAAAWSDSMSSPSTSDSYTSNPRIFAKMLPGRNYYLFAKVLHNSSITSPTDNQRAVEVMFDIPYGYKLLIDGDSRNYILETVTNDSSTWTKMWVVKLVDDNQPILYAGDSMPPYFGDEYFFDIYLGVLHVDDEEDQTSRIVEGGWLQLRKDNLINNEIGRDMIDIRQEFSDVTITNDSSNLPTEITYTNSNSVTSSVAAFSDTTNGFIINSTNIYDYTITQGSSVNEINIERDFHNAPSKLNDLTLNVKYLPSGFQWIGSHTSLIDSSSSTLSSSTKTLALVINSAGYKDLSSTLISGAYANKLVKVVVDYGDGLTSTITPGSVSSASENHTYSFPDSETRYLGSVTVTLETRGMASSCDAITHKVSYSLAAAVQLSYTLLFSASIASDEKWIFTEGDDEGCNSKLRQ